MANIIGVRFKKPGKIYFFDPDGIQIEQGKHVIDNFMLNVWEEING